MMFGKSLQSELEATQASQLRIALAGLTRPAALQAAEHHVSAVRESRVPLAEDLQRAINESRAAGKDTPSSDLRRAEKAIAEVDKKINTAMAELRAQRAKFGPAFHAAINPAATEARNELQALLARAEVLAADLNDAHSFAMIHEQTVVSFVERSRFVLSGVRQIRDILK